MRRALTPLKRLVDKHNIISEFPDTVPWYIVILSPAKEPEKAARAKNNDRLHCSLRQADLQISHITQLAAVAEIDDLLAPELAKSYKHNLHLIISLCCRQAVPFRRFSTLFCLRE